MESYRKLTREVAILEFAGERMASPREYWTSQLLIPKPFGPFSAHCRVVTLVSSAARNSRGALHQPHSCAGLLLNHPQPVHGSLRLLGRPLRLRGDLGQPFGDQLRRLT
jgi:hypothetical protein